MEWEATGFAGVANITVYLVFDPTELACGGCQEPFSGVSLPAYPAKSLVFFVWRAIGTPFCFTQMRCGASATG